MPARSAAAWHAGQMGDPAVIFDLDGTLVDSEPVYYEAGRRLLASYGVTGFTWEQHVRFVGVSTVDTLAALRAEYRIEAPVTELLAALDGHYLELARASTVAFPRMRELVEALVAAGNPLAVASGSSPEAIGAALAATGLDQLIGTAVSAQEVPRGKPEPDVFLEAARRLGVRAGDCVVLEDAPPGALAAARAGMRCVAVPSVAAQAADPAFAAAGLFFAGGQRDFDPRVALGWING